MQEQVAKKVVVGLRQIAAESVAIDGGAHSDRINGFASELAHAIGFVEADADLLAARNLAVRQARAMVDAKMVSGRQISLIDSTGQIVTNDDLGGTCARIADGQADGTIIVQQALDGIKEGRRLAAEDHERQRMADMMSAPTNPTPDQLTITIDGPQGSGKTLLGLALRTLFPRTHRPLYASMGRHLAPRIIEMREGRPFDVTGDVFAGGEATRG